MYQWNADYGEIVEGQGTNEVVVNWTMDGQHKISVEQTSTTIDTICFGESEPLFVEILNDSLEISLSAVSFNSSGNVILNFQSEKLDILKHKLEVEVNDEFGNFIKDVHTSGTYLRKEKEMFSEILRLKVTNRCYEVFYSNPQQTIVLTGRVLIQ